MAMLVLFYKSFGAQQIANRPGLVQKVVTHKDGRTVKHWVRNGDNESFGAHNTNHGDTVHYPGGRGEVVARGKHGVTVRHNETKSEHRVGWEDVHSIEQRNIQAAPKQVEKPKEQSGGATSQPGIFDGKSLFNDSDAAIGKVYEQPNVKSFDDLKKQGAEAQRAYREWLDEGDGFANQNHFEIYDGEKDPDAFGRAMRDIEGGKKGGLLLLAPVKGGLGCKKRSPTSLAGTGPG